MGSEFGAIWEDPDGGFIKFVVKRASKQDQTLHMEGKLHGILYFRAVCAMMRVRFSPSDSTYVQTHTKTYISFLTSCRGHAHLKTPLQYTVVSNMDKGIRNELKRNFYMKISLFRIPFLGGFWDEKKLEFF